MLGRFSSRACCARGGSLAAAGAVALFSIGPLAEQVRAIDIVLTYDENERPAFDPNGTELMRMAEAAASLWEDILEGSGTYDVDIRWTDLDGTAGARWDSFNDNIDVDTTLQGGLSWYFDPAPLDHSEFNLQQTLLKDLTPSEQNSYFDGNPPEVLEVGFSGTATSMDLLMTLDLFTALVHEMGHDLGIDLEIDGTFEFLNGHIGGATAGVNGGGHLDPPTALMSPSPATIGMRALPTATDILAIAGDQGITAVDLPRRDFIGGTDYNTGTNWIGGAVPDSDTEAKIRPAAAANVTMSANNAVGSLTIDNGSTLDTLGNLLAAIGAVTVMPGATLNVGAGGAVTSGALNLTGTTMSVASGGLADGDTVNLVNATVNLSTAGLAYDRLTIDAASTVTGNGSLGQVAPLPTSLVNEGTIRPMGGTLTINGDTFFATLDLDGISNLGEIDASAGSLTVRGRTLGPFAGDIAVGPNQTVDFQIGWTLAETGILNLLGTPGAPATLAGGTFAVGPNHAALLGDLHVSGDAVISADVHFFPSARVDIPTAADTLNITGFALYQAAAISGAAGTLRQTGDALVVPSLTSGIITVIQTNIFDMDGAAESASDIEIAVGATLLVISSQIEMGAPAADGYDGNLNVRGQLLVGIVAPTSDWRLDGAMHLGAGALVDGTQIRLHGAIDTNLGTNGVGTIDSNLNLQPGYVLNISSSDDTLILGGTTTVNGVGTVMGAIGGRLRQVGDLLLNANLTIPAGTDYDWDGLEQQPSYTLINPNRTLTLNANTLDEAGPATDGHDGIIDLFGNLVVNNASGQWRLDGTLNFLQPTLAPVPVIGGSSTLQLYGTINSHGLPLIDVPIVLNAGANVHVRSQALVLLRHTTYAGGQVTGHVTSGPLISRLDQRGDATVSGDATITIAQYDWDGVDATPSDTTVQAGGIFTLNVNTVDPDDNAYDGNLNVDGGIVFVNVPGAAPWRLEGRIDVGNDGPIAIGSMNGSPIENHGTIAARGIGHITADLILTDEGVLRVESPTDTLFLFGFTTYRTLAAFAGTGTLVQAGDALISGPTDTDGVNVSVYDMDGAELTPSDITILFSGGPFGPDEAFVINADQIERGDATADGFDGTLRLTEYMLEVNTAGPWRLDGTLELVSVGGNLPRVTGSDVEVHGRIDPVGRGRMQAAVHFKPTAMVIVEAGEVLHFDDEVAYEGGTYTGVGTLEHNGGIRVIGNTTIDVAVFDMDGALESNSVKVDGGSLVLNVNRLDVANNVYDGEMVLSNILTVNTPMPWSSSGEIRLTGGGAISGAALTNNGPIIGSGTVKPVGLVNNGEIVADGGTLFLSSDSFPDLDGSANNRSLQATLGNIHITSIPSGPVGFSGGLTIGIAREFRMDYGGLHNRGTINLSGRYIAEFLIQDAALNVNTAVATLDANAVFRSGSITTLNSDLRLAGTTSIEAGAVFNGNQHLRLQSGAALFSDATISVDLFNEGGVVNPGFSAGVLTIDGDFTQQSGILNIELGGASAGEFDVLTVAGTAKLGDTLAITLIDSFAPAAGDAFDILDWGSLTGTFDTLQLPALAGSLNWDTSQLYTAGVLAVVAPVLLGDYNRNGIVDAADYVVWRKTLGQTGAGLAADGNSNGQIDPGDYDVWRGHFGQTAGSGAGTLSLPAAPEPSAVTLLFLAAGVIITAARRHGRT
ncbi:MAG: hypothetical protein WD738_05440 [Pirellulales bacterium]